MTYSVLIADDNPEIRKVLKILVQQEKHLHICGEAVDGLDTMQKALELKPDLIILDYIMPRMNGLDVATNLKTSLPDTSMVLLSFYSNLVKPAEAQRAGICGVFSKTEISDLLKFLEAKAAAAPSAL